MKSLSLAEIQQAARATLWSAQRDAGNGKPDAPWFIVNCVPTERDARTLRGEIKQIWNRRSLEHTYGRSVRIEPDPETDHWLVILSVWRGQWTVM